ncbi:MAG: acyltransferase [Burkholderiales bacterium]|nr:acyltransferase [Burkholderiales bacterium]
MHPSSARPTPSLVLPIQYLRGVAAMMVVWHHAKEQIPAVDQLLPWNFGPLGVDLFFVISGFIMRLTTVSGNVTCGQFLARRAIRVVPLYWLLTIAMVGAWLVAPAVFRTLKVTPETFLQSLLFIPHFSNAFPGFAWPLLVPGWTLNFEMFFYVVFGLSLLFPKRWQVMFVAGVLLVLVLAGQWLGPFSSAAFLTYTSPLLIEFAGGVLIAEIWMRDAISPKAWVSIAMTVGGGAALLMCGLFPLPTYVQISGACLVVAGVLSKNLKFGNSKEMLLLGDSSYSLYLTHIFALGALRLAMSALAAIPAAFSTPSALLYMALALIWCGFVGVVAYRHLEKPLLAFGQKLARRPSASNSPP